MAGNPYLFDVATEAELSNILFHYNTEFVIDILNTAIDSRFKPEAVILKQPNMVSAWETNFKQMKEYYAYPEFVEKITKVREETYKEIIRIICERYRLNFTEDEEVDWFSASYVLYDFFICNFNKYLVSFLSSYIYRERSSIYDSLNLAALRKSKDSSTVYGKKLYKDIKLISINSNIGEVVQSIIYNNPITLADILNSVLPPETANYMLSIINVDEDFVKNIYGPSIASNIGPVLLTEIRFDLQRIGANNEE